MRPCSMDVLAFDEPPENWPIESLGLGACGAITYGSWGGIYICVCTYVMSLRPRPAVAHSPLRQQCQLVTEIAITTSTGENAMLST